MNQRNRDREPAQWEGDIGQSVADYADWYLREAPIMWVAARSQAVEEASSAMRVLRDFDDISVARLKANPEVLTIVRMAISPKMARDRFVEFVGVKKNLVVKMEREGILPKRAVEAEADLQRICDFAVPLLDPQ